MRKIAWSELVRPGGVIIEPLGSAIFTPPPSLVALPPIEIGPGFCSIGHHPEDEPRRLWPPIEANQLSSLSDKRLRCSPEAAL
jgi:hypothetical protein